jgi:hypothetical protein
LINNQSGDYALTSTTVSGNIGQITAAAPAAPIVSQSQINVAIVANPAPTLYSQDLSAIPIMPSNAQSDTATDKMLSSLDDQGSDDGASPLVSPSNSKFNRIRIDLLSDFNEQKSKLSNPVIESGNADLWARSVDVHP